MEASENILVRTTATKTEIAVWNSQHAKRRLIIDERGTMFERREEGW